MLVILLFTLFAVSQANVVGVSQNDACSACQTALGKGFTKTQLESLMTATASVSCSKLPVEIREGCTKTMIKHGSKLVAQVTSTDVLGVCKEFGACGDASQPIPGVFAVGSTSAVSAACDGCKIGAQYLQDILTDQNVWNYITDLFTNHLCNTAPDTVKALCTSAPSLLHQVFQAVASSFTSDTLCATLC